jgi:hypothetical protein
MHNNHQGFVLHSNLYVQWLGREITQTKCIPSQIIGLTHQKYDARVLKPESEGNQDSKSQKKRTRESQLWEGSGTSIGNTPNQENTR